MPPARVFADKHKFPLKLVSSVALACLPWLVSFNCFGGHSGYLSWATCPSKLQVSWCHCHTLLVLVLVLLQLSVHKVTSHTDHWCELLLSRNAYLLYTRRVSVSMAQDDGKLDNISAGGVFSVIGWFLVVHALLFCWNLVACKVLQLPPPALRSVVVMSTQKTFPVAATIINFLPDEVGDAALMLIACIICQQSQLFCDSIVAAFAKVDKPHEEDEDAADPETQGVGSEQGTTWRRVGDGAVAKPRSCKQHQAEV